MKSFFNAPLNLSMGIDSYLTCIPATDNNSAEIRLKALAPAFDTSKAEQQIWQLIKIDGSDSNCNIYCEISGTKWYLCGNGSVGSYAELEKTSGVANKFYTFSIVNDGDFTSSLTLINSADSCVYLTQGSAPDTDKLIQADSSATCTFTTPNEILETDKNYNFSTLDTSLFISLSNDATPVVTLTSSAITLLSDWQIKSANPANNGIINNAQIFCSQPPNKWYLVGATVTDPVTVSDIEPTTTSWLVTDNGDGTTSFESQKVHGGHSDNIGTPEEDGTSLIIESKPGVPKQKYKFKKVSALDGR
jgi:hypothetical protein